MMSQNNSLPVKREHNIVSAFFVARSYRKNIGIPAEHLPNVKKKFYKANQLVRGSGIGLAVADEIAAMHGGSLQIESQVGVGTVVTVSLPTCGWLQSHPEAAPAPEIQKLLEERNDT